ncbi:hypothetical protein TNCV_690701 [Trichonephila clavipes]|nr:hypothetical protein TNCV_690701 [Trichonephila clavipes]
MFEEVSAVFDSHSVSSEEFVVVNGVYSPNYGKDILELVQNSKNIVDADSNDESAMNNAAPVPMPSEMENIMKITRATPQLIPFPKWRDINRQEMRRPMKFPKGFAIKISDYVRNRDLQKRING